MVVNISLEFTLYNFALAATIQNRIFYLPIWTHKGENKRVHVHRDRIFKLIEIYIETGHNIVMKYDWVRVFNGNREMLWFQKY
jgi:hypothetical protein